MRSIDGSYGEGGGQLVRTALSLSALTGQAFRIDRIRAGREKPGLRAQHLTAVRAVADLCGAKVEGAEIGSQTLSFEPTMPPRPGRYRWEVGTAGAVSLVFQTVLWPLAFSDGPSEVELVGGTHVAWSPPADYVHRVYLPMLSKQAVLRAGAFPEKASPIADVVVQTWGWYPRGGGTIRAQIAGSLRLSPMDLIDRGTLQSVSVLSAASNLPDHIRQRQATRADFLLRKQGIKPQIEVLAPPSPGQGTVVFVLAEYKNVWAGFASYGRIRKPAERVAEEACRGFLRFHKQRQPVDAHLADQLLLPVALARGRTQYAVESVTPHLLTNAWVIAQMLRDVLIEIDGELGRPGLVTVHTPSSEA